MIPIKVQCTIVSQTVTGYDVWFSIAEGVEHEPAHKLSFQSRPSGVIRLDHLKKEIAQQFIPGKVYDITFSEE